MEPTMPSGCVAAVEALPERVQPGDVLACVAASSSAVYCHRVIAANADGAVLTRGDNRSVADGWVEPARQVGIVRRYAVGGRCFSASQHIRPSAYRRTRQRVANWLARILDKSDSSPRCVTTT